MLAVMLTGIVDRSSSAQTNPPASSPVRSATPLESPLQLPPPPRPKNEKPDASAAGTSKPASTRPLRIALEMAPPARKHEPAKPEPAKTEATKQVVAQSGPSSQPSPSSRLAPAKSRMERVSSGRRALKNCSAPLLRRTISAATPWPPKERNPGFRPEEEPSRFSLEGSPPKILRIRSFHKSGYPLCQ